jgi:hypothetical protein
MQEVTRYPGGCHCGAVRYEATTDLAQVISCNCSICSKRGLLWTFVRLEAFQLLSGEDQSTDYQFGKRNIHHLFCRVCGVESFARGRARDGAEMVAVNVRCLEGVEVATLNPTPFNGRDL